MGIATFILLVFVVVGALSWLGRSLLSGLLFIVCCAGAIISACALLAGKYA